MKVSSACRGERVATGGLCRPAHLCCTKTLELHKNKSLTVFSCDVVRWGGGGGGVRGWGWGAGGGGVVHVSGCRGLFGVSERGGVM